MPEYTSNAVQTVNAGQNVLLTETAVPCTKGYVVHREGSGIVTLRGITCNCFARYKISFGANIAAVTTADAISVAIAIDGEPVPTSSGIYTPAAITDDYGNVYVSLFVTVPRGCCYTIAIENTSTQAINVQNANLIIERVA
jgi:hypothetical protein